jgi:hypothetical protein
MRLDLRSGAIIQRGKRPHEPHLQSYKSVIAAFAVAAVSRLRNLAARAR